MRIKHEWRFVEAGEWTWLEVVIDAARAECQELQCTSRAETFARITEGIVSNDRWEYRITVNGTTAAIACIVPDDDPHVGPCLSMQWHYVLPEYRCLKLGSEALRVLVQLAKEHAVPYAYTRRTGAGTYTLKYGGFRGEKSKEVC